MSNSRPLSLVAILIASSLLASCAEEAAEPSASDGLSAGEPLPGPVAAAADPGWTSATPQEFPIGSWTYKPEEMAARFGAPGGEPLLSVQCEMGKLNFVRQGQAEAGGEMRILLSDGSLTMPAVNSSTGAVTVSGEIDKADAAAAGLMDESQAYVVDVDGLPTLKVPATPMIPRLAADCPETSGSLP